MIISMTGFGRGSFAENGFEAQVEVRSLNHRFLDVIAKLPRAFGARENLVRDLVREYIERGRVSVNATLRQDDGEPIGLKVNEQTVAAYKALLESLRKQAKIDEPVQLDHLLTFSDIFAQADEDEEIPEVAWRCIDQAMRSALNDLNVMRRREGKEIEKDLAQRIELLSAKIEKIETLSASRSKEEFQRLYARLQTMLGSGELDPSRLELEIALLADRVDVTEECIRFKSHNILFLESMKQAEPAGRKLNFLLQEMNREANTIGAKACDAEVAHIVVEVKEEVERLREQIQNIE